MPNSDRQAQRRQRPFRQIPFQIERPDLGADGEQIFALRAQWVDHRLKRMPQKDMATMEANEAKADNLAQTVIGSDEKQMQGYRDRLQIREVLETRLARENVLEPKR